MPLGPLRYGRLWSRWRGLERCDWSGNSLGCSIGSVGDIGGFFFVKFGRDYLDDVASGGSTTSPKISAAVQEYACEESCSHSGKRNSSAKRVSQ